jgi:Putative regulator of cell autolysis
MMPLPLLYISGMASLLMTAVVVLSGLSAYLLVRQYRQRKLVDQLIAEHELKAFRAQLDPHMLQNTFEIMAAHIVNEPPDKAISFIHTISSYLRQVLHTSDKSVVTLEEELEYAEKYLSVQKCVTNTLFEYTISIDDEVDAYGVEVPAMLLQPILENSIKHGFCDTSPGKGLISIQIKQLDNYIICTLCDNGTGLKQKDALPARISKGLQLTEKRLQLLFRRFKLPPQIEVRNNAPHGVSTILRIPTM